MAQMEIRSTDKAVMNFDHDRFFLHLSITLFVLVIGATWFRLFVGVDHTDESLYIAMPYRLWLGDRPLIDEYSVVQLPALLLEPFVQAYIRLTGGTDGIILYFRHLYLVFSIVTAVVVVRVLTRHPKANGLTNSVNGLPLWAALLVGTFCIGFVPFSIFNLGYNELCMGFLEMGTLLLLAAIGRGGHPQARLRFLAGVLHGLAIVAYPTIPPAVAVLAAPLLPWRQWRHPPFIVYPLGLFLGAGWILIFVLRVSAEQLKTAIDYTVFGGGVNRGAGLLKFGPIFADFYHHFPHKGAVLGFAALILILDRLGARQARLGLLLLPAVIATAPLPACYFGSLLFVRNIAFLGTIPFALVVRNPLARKVFLLLWCPGMIAGLVTAWSSGNGAWAFAIGGFLAAVASTILFWIALTAEGQLAARGLFSRLWVPKAAGLIFLASISVLSVLFHTRCAYGELNLVEARVRIDFGPLRGLFTTPEKYDFFRRLYTDVHNLTPRSTILFFDNVPLGYIFTAMRPLVHSLWFPNKFELPLTNRAAVMDYYRRRGATPDYVVKVNNIPLGRTYVYRILYPVDDPLIRLIGTSAYTRIIHNDYFDIFSRCTEDGIQAFDAATRAANQKLFNPIKGFSQIEAGHVWAIDRTAELGVPEISGNQRTEILEFDLSTLASRSIKILAPDGQVQNFNLEPERVRHVELRLAARKLRFETDLPGVDPGNGSQKLFFAVRNLSILVNGQGAPTIEQGLLFPVTGFRASEIDHIWAIDRIAELAIPEITGNQSAEILAFDLSTLNPRSIKVWAPDGQVQNFRLEPRRLQHVEAQISPRKLIFETNFNGVNPGNGDQRKLCFAVANLSIRGVDEVNPANH
jgi:hypothetical protein